MKHVIIGVGAAGIAAAETIRGLRPDDEIVMISKDRAVHSRCMLHHYMSGQRSEESIDFAPANFFEKYRVRWMPGTTVGRIDTANKRVETDTAGAVAYDTLLVATGANSVVPPVGALRTAANAYGLRDLCDAQAIKQAAGTADKVVVIGSGLVGLDAAFALIEQGKNVTIVEMAPYILPLQLDQHAAEAYQRLFEQHGCTFHVGIGAKDTETDAGGNITAVLLSDGTRLPCDFVVVAAGVRPATGLLADSGIEVEHRVKVGCDMRTNVPGVFAAGDVTGLSGIWPNAVKQGRVAGTNMCGGSAQYDDLYALKNTINFFGLTTLSLGRTVPPEEGTVIVREDRARYERILIRDGRVKGVILQGDISNSGFWQYVIKNEIDVSAYQDDIWHLSYTDFYALDERGEYKYAVPA